MEAITASIQATIPVQRLLFQVWWLAIPIIKIRGPQEHITFIMENLTLARHHFILTWPPDCQSHRTPIINPMKQNEQIDCYFCLVLYQSLQVSVIKKKKNFIAIFVWFCIKPKLGHRYYNTNSWWRYQMETFSALLALCAGNSPVTGEFPSQRPVRWSFDVFFDLHLE